MKVRFLTSFLLTSCLVISFTNAQPYRISDEYLQLNAGGRNEFYNIIKTDFYSDDRSDSLNLLGNGKYIRSAGTQTRTAPSNAGRTG